MSKFLNCHLIAHLNFNITVCIYTGQNAWNTVQEWIFNSLTAQTLSYIWLMRLYNFIITQNMPCTLDLEQSTETLFIH